MYCIVLPILCAKGQPSAEYNTTLTIFPWAIFDSQACLAFQTIQPVYSNTCSVVRSQPWWPYEEDSFHKTHLGIYGEFHNNYCTIKSLFSIPCPMSSVVLPILLSVKKYELLGKSQVLVGTTENI